MSEPDATPPPAESPVAPVLPGPGPQPPTDPIARAAACGREIDAALRRHNCQLVPMLTAEPVGNGSKVLTSATIQVAPQ